MSPRRVAALVVKETQELSRDPITLWVSFLMPLVMLLLYGYAITLDVKNVAMGVWDRDRTPESRTLTDGFVHSGYFRLTSAFETEREVDRALQRGRVKLALVIPERFGARIARGETVPVQVLVDGTFSNTAQIVASYANAIVSTYARPHEERIRAEVRAWYNPEMRSVNYVIPGLIGVILMAFPPLLTALAIVRERETGSVHQIFASPVTSSEFIVGKLIPYGAIAFMQILMVIAVGFLWFEVPLRGNIGLLLGSSLIYVFCAVSLGPLISTITHSQVVAMLLALVLTLMPSILFSGFLFPIFTMPYFMQLYTYVFPSRYFIELSRAIVMKGAELDELWFNIALLLAYTAAVFAAATWRFRKKVA